MINIDQAIKESFIGKITINLIHKFSFLENHSLIHTTNLPLYFSLYFLFTLLILPYFADDKFLIGIMIIILVILFIVNIAAREEKYIKFNLLDFFIITSLLVSFISTFSSYFLKASLIGLSKNILFIAFYFVLKLVLLNSSQKTLENLYFYLFICALFVSLYGIYQYSIDIPPLATWEDPNLKTHTRVYSTLGNPNLLAGYLNISLPFGFIFTYLNRNKILNLLFYLSGSLSLLLCLFFTGSRGGYVALITCIVASLIIALVFYFISNTNKKKSKSRLTIIFSLLCFFIFFLIFRFPIFKERIATLFTPWSYSSNAYRLNIWLSCLEMLKDNLLIGIGPGNLTFTNVYSLYMKSGYHALGAYNIFLETVIETGILGLIVFILIVLTAFTRLHNLFWNSNNLYIKAFAISIFIAMLSIISHGMVDTVFFRPQIQIPFWFLLASIGKLEYEDYKT